MESGLRLQEVSEGRGIDVAVEGGLEADRFEPVMEEPAGAPLGGRAPLAPGLLQGGPIELQVKAQVVGDGERGPLIEQGDEVRRDGGLTGVLAHHLFGRLGLLVHPPGGRQAEKGEVSGIGGRLLEAEDRREVSQGEGRALAGVGLEAEARRLRDLEPGHQIASGDDRGPSGAQVCREGAGGLIGAGIGQEDRPVVPLLAARSELPEVVGEDIGEELDAEGSALLALALGFGLNGDGLSIHGSFRAKGPSCPPFWRTWARAGGERSRLGRRPTPQGSALTARHPVRDPRRRKAGRRTCGDGGEPTRDPGGKTLGKEARVSNRRMHRCGPSPALACRGAEADARWRKPWSGAGRRGGKEDGL